MRIEDGLTLLNELLDDLRPSMVSYAQKEGSACIREMRARYRSHHLKPRLTQLCELSTYMVQASNPAHDLWPAIQELNDLARDLRMAHEEL